MCKRCLYQAIAAYAIIWRTCFLFLKKNTMKESCVFSVGGEGGGIDIVKVENGKDIWYRYCHSEMDPTDNGLDVNKTEIYRDFNTAFQMITNRYRHWYQLWIRVSAESKNYIQERLIEALNTREETPETLRYSLSRIENALSVKLHYKNGKFSTTEA